MPSQYVSAIILTVIVLGAGAFIVSNTITAIEMYRQRIQRDVLEIQTKLSQQLDILAAYIFNDTIVIVASTGRFPTTIYGVYIDETLAKCTIRYANTSFTLNTSVRIPSDTVVSIECPSNGKTSAFVKIVHDGGEAVAYARTI